MTSATAKSDMDVCMCHLDNRTRLRQVNEFNEHYAKSSDVYIYQSEI